MKYLIAYLLALYSATAQAKDVSFEVFFQGEETITRNPSSFGSLRHYYLKDSQDGKLHGPLNIWCPGTERADKPFQYNRVSSLDEALRIESQNRHASNEGSELVTSIRKSTALYIASSNLLILDESVTGSYLAALGTVGSANLVAKIRAETELSGYKSSGNVWELVLYGVTDRGALEKYTFSGELSPVAVKKFQSEVILAAGAIPSFAFVPHNPN